MPARTVARRWLPAQMLGLLAAVGALCSAPAAEPVPADARNPVLPPVAKSPTDQLSTQGSVLVKQFRFRGNTIFSSPQLADLPAVKKYVNRPDTMEDLEQVRQAVSEYYVTHGYINSGAVLPDQTVTDGIIALQIVEGRLSEIDLRPAAARRLRLVDGYLRSRIMVGAGPPLKIETLRDELEILRQNPNLSRINAELKPGVNPGESILDVSVEETNPLQLSLELNNKRSPSVGAERFYVLGSDRNLTGHGDDFEFRYAITKGGFEHLRPAGSDDFSVDYTLPITAHDTTLGFNFTRTDDLVTEQPFSGVDITSQSESGSVTLRHPFYRSPNAEFAMGLTGARRYNETFLLGKPFAFAPGTKNGRSDVTVLRFTQEFVDRRENRTLALRSTFNLGVAALGSTVVPGGHSDSRFLAWTGQAQYVRRIGQDTELILRLDVELATDALPALEQLSIGGFDTVRGYRENRLVRDEGLIGSAEWRIPILHKADVPILDIAPFVDLGYGYNFHPSAADPDKFIGSAGIGLLYNPNPHIAAQIYYGVPFEHFKGSDIQDKGVHFSLRFNLFE